MSNTPTSTDSGQSQSYEATYARLQQLLQELETGDLPLERALALYEEGAVLARRCAELLDAAELRVRQWLPGDGTDELTGWQDDSGAER